MAMELNKLTVGALVIGCMAAAGGGGYLAVRMAQPAQVSAARDAGAVAAVGSAVPEAAPATVSAVSASEGLVAPEPTVVRTAPTPSIKRPVASAARSARPSVEPSNRVAPVAAEPAERPAVQVASAGASQAESTSSTMWETRPAVQPVAPDVRDPEPPAAPAVEYVDLTVPSDAVLGLQIDRYLSSELARVEDSVDARVTRDVRVGDRVAIPAGAAVRGSVVEVDRGGRVRGSARLSIRFHTVVLSDGTQLALRTDPVVREGESPARGTAAKVGGGAAGGAILGAILGGGRGAAIGGAIGAGAGTAATMATDRNPATFTAGTTVTVRMQAPVTVTVPRHE